jgi:hypothetical protein
MQMLRNDLRNMYYLPNIITVFKSRTLRQAGHVARMNISGEEKVKLSLYRPRQAPRVPGA